MQEMQLKEFIPYDHLSVLKPLNEAVTKTGLGFRPNFSGQLKSKTLHLILADRSLGLIARVRPLQESSPEDIKFNLELVTAAHSAGAPFLPPITTEVLAFTAGHLSFTATLWPLADNRLVTPEEMASVLRDAHTTLPPADLPDWLHVRFRRVRGWANLLPKLPRILPESKIEESLSLMETTLNKLERLTAASPKVLLHGDAHPANMVIFKNKPFGCDLDEICVGPLEVDLAMTFLQSEKFPEAEPGAGKKLAAAYSGPYNQDILRAIVEAKAVSRLMSLVRFWNRPGIAEDFLQRLEAVKHGGRFAKFYGGEAPSPFAPTDD